MELINHPLTYARMLRGWSLDELAKQIRRAAARRGLRSGTDRQRVWKWEHKISTPGTESQILIAEAFEVPESLLRECPWPRWLSGHDAPLPLGSAYTVQALREAHGTAMDRRSFTAYSGLALVGLAAQWAGLEPGRLVTALGGKTVDTDLVTWLEETSAKLAGLPTEQRQHTATLLDAHLSTVTDLIDHGRYTQATGTRLHNLAAVLAVTCAWYRFDQGQQAAAGRLWDAALHSAHAAGNRDLGAGVVGDLAYQATWLEDSQTSVDLLDHALSRAQHPAARSLLHLRKARAHAALNEAAQCYRHLNASETALNAYSSDPAPAWCSWMSTADWSVDSGGCLLDLGQLDQAHRHIAEGLNLLPRARDKTRSVFLVYQARGFLTSGDVDQALAATTESLDLADRIGAERCVALVRGLEPAFSQRQTVQGVTEFMERLRAS